MPEAGWDAPRGWNGRAELWGMEHASAGERRRPFRRESGASFGPERTGKAKGLFWARWAVFERGAAGGPAVSQKPPQSISVLDDKFLLLCPNTIVT